jgi:predicted AAA+ superfamily ATPase
MDSYISRSLNLTKDLKQKSVLLLGPRQTGKSSFIRHQLPEHRLYNLLIPETYNKLSFNPQSLIDEIQESNKIIVIDEIQKIPALLDVIHYLIEERQIRFLLTGSSARKLKSGQANLLGGRARLRHFHPLTIHEIGLGFQLDRALQTGMIPSHYFSQDIESDLESYVGIYLQQEIAAEGLVRSIPSFSRFLEVAALGHAEQINFTAISSDAQVKRTTVHEYYQILKDTFIAQEVPVWNKGKVRKPVATSKYYFFDWGVVRKLQGISSIAQKSPLFGKAFESLIFQELLAFSHQHNHGELCYWRTTNQDEVDFVLGDDMAIEVKGKDRVTIRDLEGLIKIKEEKRLKNYILVYNGQERLKFADAPGIEVMPWRDFVGWLWAV